MGFIHWYSDPNSEYLNYGTIERIYQFDYDDPIDGMLMDITNIGTLGKACCLDFEPMIGDRVEMFIDDSDEIPGWIIKKVEIQT